MCVCEIIVTGRAFCQSTWSLCISACKEDNESESKLAASHHQQQQHSLSGLHYNHYASKPMMYGEENMQQYQQQQLQQQHQQQLQQQHQQQLQQHHHQQQELQQQQGSMCGIGTIGTSASSSVSIGNDGIVTAMQSVTPPMNLNGGQPGYVYQIQQQPQPLQYGQYYSQTITTTPPPLPQHTTLFIHETPVSLHQYVQQQSTSSLSSPSLPTFVQHPTVYIHDNQMTIPTYTQQHPSGLPQNATTVYIHEMTKQPPPGLPPPQQPGQQSLYVQETLQQHPPPGLHASTAAHHPSTVFLQDASQHPPPYLTAPPGSGQQSTIYIHEASMSGSRILHPPPSTGLPPPTIYLQDASMSPQSYLHQHPNSTLGTPMSAMQGSSGAQQQSTIIIHETTLPSQQFIAPSAPPSLSAPLPSIQLQHTPPPFMPHQHSVIGPPPPLMQSHGSQPMYGQFSYASDYGSLPPYMTHQNAFTPPAVPADDSSHVSDAHYWMAAT